MTEEYKKELETLRYAKEHFYKLIERLNANQSGVIFDVVLTGSQICIYATKEKKRTFLIIAIGYIQAHLKLAQLYQMFEIATSLVNKGVIHGKKGNEKEKIQT